MALADARVAVLIHAMLRAQQVEVVLDGRIEGNLGRALADGALADCIARLLRGLQDVLG